MDQDQKSFINSLFATNRALYGAARMEDGDDDKDSGGSGGSDFKAITSQEEFDNRIKSRLAQDRKKFTNFDEFKSKAEKFDALGDPEKLQAEKTKADERGVKLAKRLIEKAVLDAAKAKGLDLDDDDVLKLVGVDGVELDEDGDVTGAVEKIDAFAEAKPRYLKNDDADSDSKETRRRAPGGQDGKDAQKPPTAAALHAQIAQAMEAGNLGLADKLRAQMSDEQRKARNTR